MYSNMNHAAYKPFKAPRNGDTYFGTHGLIGQLLHHAPYIISGTKSLTWYATQKAALFSEMEREKVYDNIIYEIDSIRRRKWTKEDYTAVINCIQTIIDNILRNSFDSYREYLKEVNRAQLGDHKGIIVDSVSVALIDTGYCYYHQLKSYLVKAQMKLFPRSKIIHPKVFLQIDGYLTDNDWIFYQRLDNSGFEEKIADYHSSDNSDVYTGLDN